MRWHPVESFTFWIGVLLAFVGASTAETPLWQSNPGQGYGITVYLGPVIGVLGVILLCISWALGTPADGRKVPSESIQGAP